ncbi:MAG: response regulator, partial [bacterium]|nr:response regulator [bacterium]
LVIDDEDFIRELVKDFLEMEGILCDGAETAEKGMKLIEKNDYSLILLDRNLGTSKAEDNIVLIQKIKRKTPIMLLTGDADCDGEYLRQIGAVGIVFKPFQVTEFLEKIGKFL